MATIQTDDKDLGNALTKLEKLVKKGDGWLHPELMIRSMDGALSLEMPAGSAQDRIIQIPDPLLLPVRQIKVKVSKGQLDFTVPKSSKLTKLQHEVADVMFEIYNLTDKVGQHRRDSFWLNIGQYPGLRETLLNERPTNEKQEKYTALGEDTPEKDIDKFIADNFIKTRILDRRPNNEKEPNETVMPVIDFLNHNWLGSQFLNEENTEGKTPGLIVNNAQPIEGSRECYVFYTIMDALDSLISYNFIDEASPIVRSVPLKLEIEGVGTLDVKAFRALLKVKKMPKKVADLRRFFPPFKKHDDGTMEVSHLMIPYGSSPHVLRRVLGTLITTMMDGEVGSQEAHRARVQQAEAYVIEQNQAFYQRLKKDVAAMIKKEGKSPVLETLLHLAELQYNKVSAYQFMDQQMAAAG